MSARPEEQQTARFCELTRVGVTIGLVSFISVLSIEGFRRIGTAQSARMGVAILVLCGSVLVLTDLRGLLSAFVQEQILLFYRKRYYYGVLLLLSAGILFVFCPTPVPVLPQPAVVRARQPEPLPEPAPEPVVFPELTVSAIVVNGVHSGATINGKQVFVGESIMGVKLLAVQETEIEVEFKSARKALPLFLDE